MANIFAVIVTYDNRFQLLHQVIQGVVQQSLPVTKIMVVNNGSVPQSRRQLQELSQTIPIIRVIDLPSNSGSAFGYQIGINTANQDPYCQFIWLLDDDNFPHRNALTELSMGWQNQTSGDREDDLVALLSIRKDLSTSINPSGLKNRTFVFK